MLQKSQCSVVDWILQRRAWLLFCWLNCRICILPWRSFSSNNIHVRKLWNQIPGMIIFQSSNLILHSLKPPTLRYGFFDIGGFCNIISNSFQGIFWVRFNYTSSQPCYRWMRGRLIARRRRRLMLSTIWFWQWYGEDWVVSGELESISWAAILDWVCDQECPCSLEWGIDG